MCQPKLFPSCHLILGSCVHIKLIAELLSLRSHEIPVSSPTYYQQ